MKLSDLAPDDYKVEKPGSSGLKLSSLSAQDVSVEPESNSINAGSALRGAENGLLAGYEPQVSSAIGGLFPDPSGGVDAKMKSQGFIINQPENTYLSRRDAEVSANNRAAQNDPGSYYGGMIGGALLSAPLAGAGLDAIGAGTAAKGAGLGTKLIQAAKGGAVIGAVQNPGDVQGQIDPIQGPDRLKNATTGAFLGAATQAVTSGVQGVVKKVRGIPDFINDFAEMRAAKAAGATKPDLKGSMRFDEAGDAGSKMRSIGRYALDNKLVQAGDSIQDVADRTSDLKGIIGKRLGDVYDRAQSVISDPEEMSALSPAERSSLSKTDFNPKKMAGEFLDRVTKNYTGDPNGQEVINRASALAENLSQNGATSDIGKIHDFRSALDDMIYKSDQAFKRTGVSTPGSEAMGELRDYLSGKITDRMNALDSIFKGSLGEDLKSLNKQYSTVSQIHSMAKNKLSAVLGNEFFSPTDKASGIAGGTAGAMLGYEKGGIPGAIKGGLGGLALGVASKGARTYGGPAVTSLANSAGPLLNSVSASPVGAVARGVGAATSGAAGLLANPALVGRAAGLMNEPNPVPDYSTVPKNVLGANQGPSRYPARGTK